MGCKWLIVLLSAGLAQPAQKDRSKFSPGTVSSFRARQTNDKVTVAARAYLSEADVRAAFGKLNPYQHGILPILVVIANDGDQTVALGRLRVELVTPDRERVEATPAAEVRFLTPPAKPGMTPGPIPGRLPGLSRRKNPLDAWEIEGRAFAARMLPPKESASGFFYFQVSFRAGSQLYLTGMREAASGKELLYFELPLERE